MAGRGGKRLLSIHETFREGRNPGRSVKNLSKEASIQTEFEREGGKKGAEKDKGGAEMSQGLGGQR